MTVCSVQILHAKKTTDKHTPFKEMNSARAQGAETGKGKLLNFWMQQEHSIHYMRGLAHGLQTIVNSRALESSSKETMKPRQVKEFN